MLASDDDLSVTVRGVVEKQILIPNPKGAMPKELATGYPEPKNLGIMPAYGLFARHVKGLELANIKFAKTRERHDVNG